MENGAWPTGQLVGLISMTQAPSFRVDIDGLAKLLTISPATSVFSCSGTKVLGTEAERRVQVISEIVAVLVAAHEARQDIDLNRSASPAVTLYPELFL